MKKESESGNTPSLYHNAWLHYDRQQNPIKPLETPPSLLLQREWKKRSASRAGIRYATKDRGSDRKASLTSSPGTKEPFRPTTFLQTEPPKSSRIPKKPDYSQQSEDNTEYFRTYGSGPITTTDSPIELMWKRNLRPGERRRLCWQTDEDRYTQHSEILKTARLG